MEALLRLPWLQRGIEYCWEESGGEITAQIPRTSERNTEDDTKFIRETEFDFYLNFLSF